VLQKAAPEGAVRSVSIIIAALAALVTAVVAFRHFEGVRHLREAYGVTQFPLLSPALLVPSGGIALAAWLLRLGRNGYAAVASAASLLIAGLFFLAQSAGGIGGPCG
jgi:cytochrome bd-type quinol oxidase subunit 2